ncbi:T9SS type B sorting domain-containing protein [Tenacibaculum sp. FZY0031]|uniref:T9SS type B sorting domain-containing protein n=1 Tax=Tenacibaculum sp. FZY0031 TaxID=3116648 RepID=UPI002ECE9F03|nr:T9SS type B sorting domain-containing protein [Tenacibaculum sp. FZY0031]
MKKKLLSLSYFFLLFISFKTFAQLEAHLKEGEGWIKGNYVEIGINSKGVFGANTSNKPATFHDNRETSNFLFGFIANPQKDDWVDYDGDFFTPGAAEEGFVIEINGINFSNNNVDFVEGIDGEILSSEKIESDCFDNLAQITWQGTVDDLQIKRLFSVTENGLFIQMITSITNTSNVVKNDVYFMNNVDPDNNVTLTTDFSTNLEIVSQPSPTNNISIVKATQNPVGDINDQDGSAVSFYANDQRAKVSFGGFSNRSASQIWNGIGVINTVGATTLADEAMSISFNLGNILPKETKTFVYYYILKEIDETFVPLIVNISTSNPTGCDAKDGSILLSGLDKEEKYLISYMKNGVLIPEKNYTTDSAGDIKLLNLEEGEYSNFKIKYKGCATELNSIYKLAPPSLPSPTFHISPLTSCGGNDGIITLSQLSAYEEYTISYTKNGLPVPEVKYTTDSLGDINISGLEEGTYADFKITYKSCVKEFNKAHSLTPPQPAVPTLDSNAPTNCEGDNGEVIISELPPNEDITINYQKDGINVNEITLTSSNDGKIIIDNLVNATYSDFNFVYPSIACSNSSDKIITLKGTTPFHVTSIPDQYFCDNDFDFITNIKLDQFDHIALGSLNSDEYTVTYHTSLENATNSIKLNKENYTTTGVGTYSLFVKVTYNDSGCYNVEEFPITINIPADFNIDDTYLCKRTDTNYALPEIATNLNSSEYTFEWLLDGVPLSLTTPTITANQAGTYKVKVTSIATGCSSTDTAKIIPSGEPDALKLVLNSKLFADNHIVTVHASGLGKYIYRLNDGAYQESPVFENVPPGNNTFYVLDENGCGEVNISKTIIDYPRFFTPNDDNINDIWHIIGVKELNSPTVQIFDRYGKPLTILTKESDGWNGIYNGKRLPTNDYWFVLFFIDENGVSQQVKSHFSLLY